MHVHRERALLGVSILMMPSSVPSFPEKLFMESQDTDSEMEKQNKNKPNKIITKNVSTEKQVDEEKGSFTPYTSAASEGESNGDTLLLLALQMGSS